MRFPAQICEQKPQLSLLVCKLTHELPHRASPGLQPPVQLPRSHTVPPVQRLPHEPQLLPLDWRS